MMEIFLCNNLLNYNLNQLIIIKKVFNKINLVLLKIGILRGLVMGGCLLLKVNLYLLIMVRIMGLLINMQALQLCPKRHQMQVIHRVQKTQTWTSGATISQPQNHPPLPLPHHHQTQNKQISTFSTTYSATSHQGRTCNKKSKFNQIPKTQQISMSFSMRSHHHHQLQMQLQLQVVLRIIKQMKLIYQICDNKYCIILFYFYICLVSQI